MIQVPIEIGDVILRGKFRNKRVQVKTIGVDEHGSPTVNGKSILNCRIEKTMPKKKQEENMKFTSKEKKLIEAYTKKVVSERKQLTEGIKSQVVQEFDVDDYSAAGSADKMTHDLGKAILTDLKACDPFNDASGWESISWTVSLDEEGNATLFRTVK